MDACFLMDMFITFFTTISDKGNMMETTDKKLIAKRYISFWFWIDLISIFPFDDITSLFISSDSNDKQNNSNMLIRTLKMGKIGKLIRLMRLVKVFKILKNK